MYRRSASYSRDQLAQTKLTAYQKRHNRSPRYTQRWNVAIGSPVPRLLRLVHGCWPPGSRPDPSLERFRQLLTEQRFQPAVIPSQVSAVRVFLRFLQSHSIAIEAATPEDVASYLEPRLAEFERKYKRHPRSVSIWRYWRTGPIRRYLQLVRGQWPPEKRIEGELDVFRHQVCTGYGHWLTCLHGLSQETLHLVTPSFLIETRGGCFCASWRSVTSVTLRGSPWLI